MAVSAGARAAPFLFALVIPRIATKPGENVQSMVLVFEMPIEEARSFSGLGPEDAAAIAARACHGPHCHRHGTTRREPRCSFELVPILWIRLHELDLIDVFIQLVAYLLQETERPDLCRWCKLLAITRAFSFFGCPQGVASERTRRRCTTSVCCSILTSDRP